MTARRPRLRKHEARITQAKAQAAQQNAQYMAVRRRRLRRSQAGLNRIDDILKKHNTLHPSTDLSRIYLCVWVKPWFRAFRIRRPARS